MKLILGLLDELLDSLQNSVALCPLWVFYSPNSYIFDRSLREGFLALYKEASVKFPELSLQTMTGVIFLRFYCPTIIFPAKFGLLNETEIPDLPKVHKALIVTSKILQTLANGGEFEPGRVHSPLIDRFVANKKTDMVQFTLSLLVTLCDQFDKWF